MNHHHFSIARLWMPIFLVGILLNCTQADARLYSNVYVFGGMWEEIGNNQSQGYHMNAPFLTGRRSNGKSYVEHLAQKLGFYGMKPSKEEGTNYAYGPTGTPDWPQDYDKNLQEQIDDFEADLEDTSADPDALYIVGGFQDFYVGETLTGPDTLMTAIRRLAGLGAVYFACVEKIEPLAFLGFKGTVYNENSTGMDRINAWSSGAGSYNRKLGNLAGKARTSEGLNIFIVPYRKWIDAANLADVFLNIESPPSGADVDRYFNLVGWGTGSSYSVPSGKAHELLADLALLMINRHPTVVEEIKDLSLSMLDEPAKIYLSNNFIDPDGDPILYTISVSVDSVVQVKAAGSELTLTPIADGLTTVKISAEDGISGKRVTDRFDVTVLSRPGTISLAVASMDFGEVEIKQEGAVTITVNNTGEGPLNVTDVQSDIAGITPSETEFTIPVGGSHDLTLTFKPAVEGMISGTLTILSDDADNGTLTLVLSGSAVIIAADPRVDFNADGQINLTDFLLFVQAFNSTDSAFDLNNNDTVDLGDFMIFAQNFSRPLL